VPYHVKIDTGLTRSGCRPEQATELLDGLAALPDLVPEGILTHFAASDEQDSTSVKTQLDRLLETVNILKQAGHSFALVHSANSGALLGHPETHLSLVRAGIALYGYEPSPYVQSKVSLVPALSLVSKVVRVTSVPAGTGVGYGFEHRCAAQSTIALVPIGYGDGLPRSLGNGHGRALIRGELCPIVGRVSMDQITIDVTDVSGVDVGDEAVLIGAQGAGQLDADQVGTAAGTISYDVLTGLMPRVPRVYVQDGALLD
jgi:alanine racemase